MRMWSICSGRAASTLLLQQRTEASWNGVRPDGAKLAHQNLVANLRYQVRVGSSRVWATRPAATKLLVGCHQSNCSAVTRFIVSLECHEYFELEILVHVKINPSYIR